MDGRLELEAATTALVVVDLQNDFCSEGGYYAMAGRDVSGLAAAVGPAVALLGRARAAGVRVVFTRIVLDAAAGAMEARHGLRPKRWFASGERLVAGSWGAALVEGLAPRAGELVVDKQGYSAFHGTVLEEALRAQGVRTLLLCGVVTYACVLATGFAAFDRGFDVVVASEATGSWVAGLGPAGLEIVDLLLGHAVASDGIVFTGGGGVGK